MDGWMENNKREARKDSCHVISSANLALNCKQTVLHQSNHHADQDRYAVPAEYITTSTTCLICTPFGAAYFYSLNGQEVHRSRRLHGTSHLLSAYINLLCKI
jgi:hypothetical protein